MARFFLLIKKTLLEFDSWKTVDAVLSFCIFMLLIAVLEIGAMDLLRTSCVRVLLLWKPWKKMKMITIAMLMVHKIAACTDSDLNQQHRQTAANIHTAWRQNRLKIPRSTGIHPRFCQNSVHICHVAESNPQSSSISCFSKEYAIMWKLRLTA